MKTLIDGNGGGCPVSNTRSGGGSVLVTVLVMLTVLAVVAGAMLTLVYQEYVLSKRSLAWNQALYGAETGVELTWNELNKLTAINTNSAFMSGTNWTYCGTNTWVCNNATISSSIGNEFGASYTVSLNTNLWVIRSTGTSSSARINSSVSRTVAVYVSPTTPFEWAILSKGVVNFGGNNPLVDSWNSSLGAYSATPGAGYTRRMNGTVGTDGKLINAAGADIYGSVATGAGGVVTTSPGFNMYSDATSRNGTNTISDGLKVYVPSVSAPWTWQTRTVVDPSSPQLSSISGTATYEMHSPDHSNLAISGSGTLILYVDSFSQQGNEGLTITPNPVGSSLQVIMYVKNSLNLTGNGGVNMNGTAANLQIYGLPTCTSIDLGGTQATQAAIYAPDSSVTIHGTADFFGAFVGKTFTISGTPNIHYDESLDTVGSTLGFSLVSYREQ